MRPNRSTAAVTAASESSLLVMSSLATSRPFESPSALLTCRDYGRWRQAVTRAENRLRSVQAHPPPSAGDDPRFYQPCLLQSSTLVRSGPGQCPDPAAFRQPYRGEL